MQKINVLNEDEFFVPEAIFSNEIKVKGSKFIANLFPVSTKEEAEIKYELMRKQYYDASHNCFAYRIGADNFRFSDDGEPSGTAGKPILQVIDHFALLQVLCVVTRYFGGIKLGSGGLMRAYSEAAKAVLAITRTKKKFYSRRLRLLFNYDLENMVRKLINEAGGKILHCEYASQIMMELAIPKSKAIIFIDTINGLGQNKMQIKED